MAQWASHHRMPRWFIPALFLMATAVPAFAQFGGVQLPGMGRNRGGYPPGQNPNSQNTNKVYGPTETITGSIQRISSSDLVIDAGDDRIVLIVIQNGTKYLSTMDKVKASDFEPGDHVTVDATRDSNDHYYSKTITMNKKGTAEDKAAAMKASDASSHSGGSGGGSSGSDSDPDRPRLHRANSDSGTSGSQANSDSSQSSSPPGSPSSGAPAPVSAASRSDAGSTGSGSTSRASSAPSSGSSSSSSGDDSGPPVLRRGSPQSSPAPDTQVASSSPPAGVRPSLSADDANGVTRVPVTPPPSASVPNSAQTDRDIGASRTGRYGGDNGGDPVIEQAREAAFSFTDTLPNYVVKQMTNRYASGQANRGRTSWQPLDIVTTDLIYEDGKERYTNIMVNGKPTKYIEQTGSWSEGEFASMLQAILAPGTNADFRNQHSSSIVNRAAYRYDYTVEQPKSTWTLHADGQTYKPSYTGAIWIDKATFRVLRIEIAARNLPRDFPLDTAESSIDYDFVLIGDQKVLLPSHAEALSCVRGTPDCTRNQTDFRNYKKYGAETNITFEGTADK